MAIYKKGDLVLTSNGEATTTCIILSERYNIGVLDNNDFYYSYCLETGLYGMLYTSEIFSRVAEEFMPDWETHDSLFQLDLSFYDYLFDAFSYFPSIFPSGSFDED